MHIANNLAMTHASVGPHHFLCVHQKHDNIDGVECQPCDVHQEDGGVLSQVAIAHPQHAAAERSKQGRLAVLHQALITHKYGLGHSEHAYTHTHTVGHSKHTHTTHSGPLRTHTHTHSGPLKTHTHTQWATQITRTQHTVGHSEHTHAHTVGYSEHTHTVGHS